MRPCSIFCNAAMQRPLRLMRFHAIHAMPRSVPRRRDFTASVRRRRDPAAQRPPTDNDSENRVLPAGRDRNRSASESGRGQPQSTMEPPPAIRRRRRANRCPPWNRRLRFDGIPITPAAIPRCETTPPESFARPCAGPRSTRSRAPAFVPVAMKLVRVCARAPAGPRQLAAQV